MASITRCRPRGLSSPVFEILPLPPCTLTTCGMANMSTCELFSHSPESLSVNSLQSNRMSRFGSPAAHGAGCTTPSVVSRKSSFLPNDM